MPTYFKELFSSNDYSRALLYFAILFYGFTILSYLLNVTEHPLGMDGYYYLLQQRSLSEDGSLYISDSPITFLLISITSEIVSPVNAIKLVSVFSLMAILYFNARLVQVVSKSAGLSALATILIATSPNIELYLAEFIKNSLGLALFGCLLYQLWQLNRDESLLVLAFSLILILIIWLTHKAAFGLALMYLLSWCVFNMKRAPIVASLIFLVSLLLVCLGTYIDYGTLGFDDLFRQLEQTSIKHDIEILPLPLRVEGYFALLATLAGSAYLLYSFRDRNYQLLSLLLPSVCYCGVVTIIWWGDSLHPEGIKARLYLMSFIPASIVISIVISRLNQKYLQLCLGLGIALVKCLIVINIFSPVKQYASPESAIEELKSSIQTYLPPDAVIVFSERYFVYRIAYDMRRPTRLCQFANNLDYWRVELAAKSDRFDDQSVQYSEHFSYMPISTWLAKIPAEKDYCRR